MRLGVAHRSLLVALSQVLNSGTNFATTFLLARALTPSELGPVALAFAVIYLGVGLSRGALSEPLLALWDERTSETRGVRAAAKNALGGGVLTGLAVFACVSLNGGPLALYWVALACPFILFQDVGRYVGFARRMPARSAALDLMWVATQAVAFPLFGGGANGILLAWALGGTVSGVGFALHKASWPPDDYTRAPQRALGWPPRAVGSRCLASLDRNGLSPPIGPNPRSTSHPRGGRRLPRHANVCVAADHPRHSGGRRRYPESCR